MWPRRPLFGALLSFLLGVDLDVGSPDPRVSFQIGFPGRSAVVGSHRRRAGIRFLRSLAGSVPLRCQVVGTRGFPLPWEHGALSASRPLDWKPSWVYLETVTQSPAAALGRFVGAAPPGALLP